MTYNKQFIILILTTAIFTSGCASIESRRGPRVFTFPTDSTASIESKFEFPKPSDYKICVDDIIEVNIWRHPDLSREVIIGPDGKISYLLIGDFQAAGLTVAELDAVITKKFE